MQAIAKILRACVSEHSSKVCEQIEQWPNCGEQGSFGTPKRIRVCMGHCERCLGVENKEDESNKLPYLVFLIPYQCFCGIHWPFQRDSSGL